jgi:hypothetical protein
MRPVALLLLCRALVDIGRNYIYDANICRTVNDLSLRLEKIVVLWKQF